MEHPEQCKTPAGSPVIILVEPQLGENIGMVARAMANFGLAELRLVNPRDGWPNDKARAAASKADHVIDAPRSSPICATAVADLNFVFATTARERDGFKPVRGAGRGGASAAGRAAQAASGPASCSGASGSGCSTRRSRWPTRSSPFRSTRPSPRSTSRRRCC